MATSSRHLKTSSGWQAQRREATLKLQAAQRQRLLDQRRQEAAAQQPQQELNSEQLLDCDGAEEQTPAVHVKQRWSALLTVPEWMSEVPADLHQAWYVMARPEGQRCIVESSEGRTTSRARNGALIHRFRSPLPNGSSATGASQSPTLLDCIFHEPANTYYVVDVLSWNGCDLSDCTLECRLAFWVHSKLAELPQLSGQEHGLAALPFAPFSAESLRAAHSGPLPFQRDGCLFLHKDALYQPGSTPLVLVWKDAICSRWVLDTDPEWNVPEQQILTLSYCEDGSLVTEDEPPVCMGSMGPSSQLPDGKPLRPGRLLKFALAGGSLRWQDGQPVGAALTYVGAANQRKGRADTFSKVVFQYRVRHDPIGLENLLQS